MNRIEIAPDGDIEVGRIIDDRGEAFVGIKLVDDEAAILLQFRPEHFVHFADKLAAYADGIVAAKANALRPPDAP